MAIDGCKIIHKNKNFTFLLRGDLSRDLEIKNPTYSVEEKI